MNFQIDSATRKGAQAKRLHILTRGNRMSISKAFRIALALGLMTSFSAQSYAATVVNAGSSGPAVTKTEVVASKNLTPMLSETSPQAMLAAEERYANIVAKGGWGKIAKAGLKKGASGDAVAKLNQRLYVEGYLRVEGVQGEFASIFTTATADALQRFQANHGLAVTGQLDKLTVNALNVSAQVRLRTIRQNIPRLQVYSEKLGSRYVVVNVPSQQIETVANGRVYSRHNAVVGRPERPTPVVMTALSEVKFNPYWNAPASIVERDIIPKLQSGTRLLDDMNIKVFDGVGGPEIDPGDVDWDNVNVEEYHFRQEPGPENAMATAKVDFQSTFGIYLHDTPEKQLFKSGRRFFSSGCVRVEKMDVLVNWILNGQDGYNGAQIASLAETLDRIDVKVAVQPQLRVVYLTAWPVGNTVAFRDDVYDLDNSGFTVGQPMPVGEESPDGLRYTLKVLPRLASGVDDSGGFWFFGGSKKNKEKRARTVSVYDSNDDDTGVVVKKQNGTFIKSLVEPGKKRTTTAQAVKAKKAAEAEKKKSSGGLFDWTAYRKKQAAENAKTASPKKIIKNTKSTEAKKTAAVDAKVKPAATAKKPAAATTKTTTSKPPAAKECLPDASGKTPKECAGTVKKTAAKAEKTEAAKN